MNPKYGTSHSPPLDPGIGQRTKKIYDAGPHSAPVAATPALEADGRVFDWRPMTDGLFTVKAVCQKKRPECAAVAVHYRGYWFDIDDTDHATKSTFTLLRPTRRLDLGSVGSDRRAPSGPALTLPVGR